jgi:hypothetical protein
LPSPYRESLAFSFAQDFSMVTDDGSFTLLALPSIQDQKFFHFQFPECHPNWANELYLDARKKLSTLDIQRSCLDLRDCLCCDDDDL